MKTNQREFQKKSKELPRKFQENSKKQLLTRNNDSHESHESHEIHETIETRNDDSHEKFDIESYESHGSHEITVVSQVWS